MHPITAATQSQKSALNKFLSQKKNPGQLHESLTRRPENGEQPPTQKVSRDLERLNERIAWTPSFSLPLPKDDDMEDSATITDRYEMNLQAKRSECSLMGKMMEFMAFMILGIIRKNRLLYLGRNRLTKSKMTGLSHKRPFPSR